MASVLGEFDGGLSEEIFRKMAVDRSVAQLGSNGLSRWTAFRARRVRQVRRTGRARRCARQGCRRNTGELLGCDSSGSWTFLMCPQSEGFITRSSPGIECCGRSGVTGPFSRPVAEASDSELSVGGLWLVVSRQHLKVGRDEMDVSPIIEAS